MRRFAIVLCTLGMSYALAAQSLETAAVAGGWKNGTAPIGWASLFTWRQLDTVALGAWIPAGRSLVSWDDFSIQGYGLGLNLTGPQWTTHLMAGISVPAKVPISWNGNDYSLQVSPAAGALIFSRTEETVWGAADVEADGEFTWADQLALGPFHAGGRLLFGGTSWLGGFLAEADLNFHSNFSILGVSPIEARGALQVWTAGLWTHQTWTWTWGSFDVLAAGGLYWVPRGNWQITSFETRIILEPPWITTVSSTSGYGFAANPGWLFVVKPTFSWYLNRAWSLEASRWLPIVGGWSLTKDSSVLANASFSRKTSPYQTAVNWLLAGTSVGVRAQW